MTESPDMIVIGAALNGLAAAVALGGPAVKRPLNVTVVDAKDPKDFASTAFDGRASAITASARRMFEALGVWRAISPHAQAMAEIIVTDTSGVGEDRPVLLRFGEENMAEGPSAHMVENRFLYQAMHDAALASKHISFAIGKKAMGFRFGPGTAEVILDGGASLRAPLLVAADGRNSPAREAAGIRMQGWPYDQCAIVATVAHDRPHNGRAEEHFLPSGPFAILPLPGNRSSLVWTERRAEADRIMNLLEAEFLEELRRRFGTHLGEVRLESGCHSYPLALHVAEEFVGERLALIGDAAHVLHPLAGLGFNLGLRDVAALAEAVHDAAALGLDVGSGTVLECYATWRRFDTVATATAMEGLNRLFSNSDPGLRSLRRTGLSFVDKLGVLKSMFVKEAAGNSGSLPKLLRGEPI